MSIFTEMISAWEAIDSLVGIIIIAAIIYMLINLWVFGDGRKMKSLHGDASLKDIVKGKLYSSFSDKRNGDVMAGFEVRKTKSGKLKISPSGTHTNQAVYKTLK